MDIGSFIDQAHWSPLHLLIPVMIIFRLTELGSAKRNHATLLTRGAVEIGADHYPAFVVLHTLWFLGMLAEVIFLARPISPLWPIFLLLFIGARILRAWAMRTLGDRWSTRIMVLPGAAAIKRGPYRHLRHPIYVAVATELITLPLIFSAYITAITISLLNAALLRIRIGAEENALKTIGKNYGKMKG